MERENFSNFIDKLEEKSADELANFISLEEPSRRDSIKAIFDSKLIKNLKQLARVIEENNIKTGKYNEALANLTKWILLLTGVMTIATIISIFK